MLKNSGQNTVGAAQQPERFYFLDAMRATLMVLGVVLHSAEVFNPEHSWLIYSQNTSWLMTDLIDVIHTFRMPAFFVVSGFFCVLTFRKYQFSTFILVRFKRLAIPFFFTALTVNTVQALILNQSHWQYFEVMPYLHEGQYISHLWFLVVLLIYFLLTAIGFAIFRPVSKPWVTAMNTVLARLPVSVLLFLLPVLSLEFLSLNKIGVPIYSNVYGLIDTYELIHYLPYFLFGLILASEPRFFQRFCQYKLSVALTAILITSLLAANIIPDSHLTTKIISVYLKELTVWMAITLCFGLFYRFLNTPSRRILFLSDASYTVYLFHHVFVIVIGLLLINLNVPAIIGFCILVTTVSIISFLIHRQIISRQRLAAFAFNGK